MKDHVLRIEIPCFVFEGKEIIEIVKKNKTQGYKLKVSFEDFFKFMERIKTE